MKIESFHVFRLADYLERIGLAGPRPIDAARALFATITQQPGGDDPNHQAAHNAMVLQLVRGGYGTGVIDPSKPEAAMLILARLVYAGATDTEICRALPQERAA